jgi:hypothetical protein
MLSAGIEFSKIPDRIESSFEWLSVLALEAGSYGWVIRIAFVGWIIWLVKEGVSLGKFAYEGVGRFGEGRFSEVPFGGGIKVVELPVEG